MSSRLVRIAACLWLLGRIASSAHAAPTPLPPPGTLSPAQPPADEGWAVPPPSLAGFEDLVLLPGDRAAVHYPPGALDRGARIQLRLEALHELWFNLKRLPPVWNVFAVNREMWEKAGLGPAYGTPHRVGPTTFIVPAEGDAGTVALARALLGGELPDPGGDPVLGTREEAASLIVSDLLLEVEAAHAVTEVLGLSGDQPWVSGVLVELVVRIAWDRLEPDQLLSYVALFDRIAARQGGPQAFRLADYRHDLPFTTELWYQAQFVRGADAIWVESGRYGSARRLDKWFRKGETVTAQELLKKYPALLDWQRAAFAP